MVARGLRALRAAAAGGRGGGRGRRGLSTRPARAPAADYQDAIRTLNSLQTNASFLEQLRRERPDPRAQLEAMRGFLERSGLQPGMWPQGSHGVADLQVEDLDGLNIIHVTGTKGKGSACAFTERILRGYGLKTGFYSSPHLVQVRERIRINGQPLSKELFSKYFWLVYNRLEETKDAAQASMPAYFRFLTIMAFHVFLQEKVDLAVLEVGIGGAYDCTNIIRTPVVCGVSSLGIDHTSILGDTVEKIAWQKGGIFKPGVPAFTVPQPERPLEVLRDRARELGCPLYVCPELDAFEAKSQALELGLAGGHQRSNAALALQLARTWLQRRGYEAGPGVLPEVPPSAEPSAQPSVPLAPVFRPSDAMIQGEGLEGHGVAGPHAGAAPRCRDVVHRRGAHHQQRPGLRPLVPPGCPQPRQAPGRLRGARAALQRHGGPGHGRAAKAAAALPLRLRRLLPQLHGAVGERQRRPTKLQRDPGERPDPLPGEPEDVGAAAGGEGGPGAPLVAPPPAGGGAAGAGPLAGRGGSPAAGAPGRAPPQLPLPRLPLPLPRPAVDRPGPGPPPPHAPPQGGGSPPARGQQRGRAAAGGGRRPRPRHRQPAPGGGGPQAAGPLPVPVRGIWGSAPFT